MCKTRDPVLFELLPPSTDNNKLPSSLELPVPWLTFQEVNCFVRCCKLSLRFGLTASCSALFPPEWCERRASGVCGRRGVRPSASGWWGRVSKNHRALQGWLHQGPAGVSTVAHWSVCTAGGPFLWQVWHLCTVEHYSAKGSQTPRYTTLSSEAWRPTEQDPVPHRHSLGQGERKLHSRDKE